MVQPQGADRAKRAAKADASRHADWLEAVAQSQDRTAFTHLFDHFGPRVKAYLMRLGADDALAEEIAQDVMVTLWRKAHLFDRSKSSVATWLFRIARNRRIDVLRRKRTVDVDAETLVIEDESLPDPDETLDEDGRRGRIREALAKLPPQQLQLVELAFFTELSHSQIAEETGLPLGTVKSRIRLAFGRLRRVLDEDDAVDTPGG
ncbi:MAG: sigma-70 family RNA polymerase sigma factor [Cohaesibacteraceae bacterium]